MDILINAVILGISQYLKRKSMLSLCVLIVMWCWFGFSRLERKQKETYLGFYFSRLSLHSCCVCDVSVQVISYLLYLTNTNYVLFFNSCIRRKDSVSFFFGKHLMDQSFLFYYRNEHFCYVHVFRLFIEGNFFFQM